MERRAGIILQARMSSRRLPAKALARVGEWPVVEHCLRRLKAAGAGDVILATTVEPDDDALEAVAARLGVPCFRGDAADVLDRFVRCANSRELHYVIRATADNPAVDVLAPGRVLDLLRRTGADYVYEDGLPYGGAVEGVTCEALVRAAALARDAFDREHVTTLVRRRTDLFRVVCVPAPPPLVRPDVRVTIDTAEDLIRVRELFALVPPGMPALRELIDAWDRTVGRSVA